MGDSTRPPSRTPRRRMPPPARTPRPRRPPPARTPRTRTRPTRTPSTSSTRGRRRRARRPAGIFKPLGVVFFFLPIAMWAVGIQSQASDNRALAPFPHSWTSWKVMDETAAYTSDHVPFRGLAIRWRADATQALFNEAPPSAGGALGEAAARNPTARKEKNFLHLPPAPPEPTVTGSSDVIVGKDGWLYGTTEYANECSPQQPPADVVANLRRLQQIITRSGRTFALALAPDKSTAEPEHLPDDNPYATCGAKAKATTWSLLTQAKIPGVLNTRAFIAAHEAKEHRDYYLRKDTHWNGLARAAVAEALVREIDPSLLAKTRVVDHISEYTGDLTQLLGTPETDTSLDATVERAGVRTVTTKETISPGVQVVVTRASSTAAPLTNGGILLVGDSFALSIMGDLSQFANNTTWIHTGQVRQIPATTAEQIAKSRTVVVVWAERYFASTTYGTLWSTQFLDKLEQQLPALNP